MYEKKENDVSFFVLTVGLVGCSKNDDNVGTIQPSTPSSVTATINYEFTGDDKATAGYAQGDITFNVTADGTYELYWADDEKALDGYYPIATLDAKAKKDTSFTFEEQTAIPVGATSILAIEQQKEANKENAIAVYDLPKEKQLDKKSGDMIYSFNSYFDIHIDEEHWGENTANWWVYSEQHWANALDFAVAKKSDFIVTSGDHVTNGNYSNLTKEWQSYEYILSQSDYVNPIWECGGNHEVEYEGLVKEELDLYKKGTGLDSTDKTLDSERSYYTIKEPNSGDLFIFMSLETANYDGEYQNFTTEQLDWLEQTLKDNYGKGYNIYLLQHALVRGYGAGDSQDTPYYGGSLSRDVSSVARFVSMIEQYPDLMWISGHSHEDYCNQYNYSDNNNTSCHMIHNSSVACPTHIVDNAIDYTLNEEQSQGYFVQVFDNAILFQGADLVQQKIYPTYCYIINGKTAKKEVAKEEIEQTSDEVTKELVHSAIANVRSVLGICYEYSSYDQYQSLKKCYYEYKDADLTKLSQDELTDVYSRLGYYKKALCQIAE